MGSAVPYPYSYGQVGYHHYPQILPTNDHSGDNSELNQLKRSLNLVQTRKTDNDRYQ